MKYSDEVKKRALASIQKIGVVETSKALGVSVPTLYIWKNEAEPQSATKKIQTMLENDPILQKKIEQQENEITELRATVVKYRAALAALLGAKIEDEADAKPDVDPKQSQE